MSFFVIPDIGCFDEDCGFIKLEECSDGFHKVGENGVVSITATGDRKAEFIAYENKGFQIIEVAVFNGNGCYGIHSV